MAKVERNKKKQRSFFVYSEDDMKKAIIEVKENGLSKKKATLKFNVPRSTLIRKLSGKVLLSRKMGPATELSKTEEDLLVNWILAMAKKGFPVHKKTLTITVKKILEASGRDTRFISKSSLPGRSWFEGFLRRHPNIKQRHTESVSKARAAVTQDRIHSWFDEIFKYLQENKLDDILLDPSRIFNGDEAGFQLCPKSGKVLGPAKLKEDFYERVSSEKEQITVMATFSANGKVVPPMLIFPYKKMPKSIVESVPEQWALGRSDSGWMNSDVFYEYIGNHFLPYLIKENISRPVLFFVDGHKSHLTQQLCDDHGIVLISLFPNSTHIMQPADVAVFKALKSGWTTAVRDWKFENFPKEVTRYTMGGILKFVFDQYAKTTTIENGFRKCGLYPWDKTKVDYSKCIPNRQIVEHVNPEKNQSTFQRKVLQEIEKRIGTEDLDQFLETYESGHNWMGNKESTNLYKVWSSIKNECHVTSESDLNTENQVTNTSVTNETVYTPRITIPKTAVPSEMPISTLKNITQSCGEITPEKSVEPIAGCSMWKTPPDVKDCYYEAKEQEGFKIPTPLKKILVLPRTPEKTTSKRKRTVYPAVISCGKYRECYEYAEKKKLEKKTKTNPAKKSEKQGEQDLIPATITKNATSKNKIEWYNSDSSNSPIDVAYDDDDDMDSSDNGELELQVGKYGILKYEEKYYPGLILKCDNEGAEIRSMVSAGVGSWKWPVKEDILYYFKNDIVRIIADPVAKNNRGFYTVPEMDNYE